MGLGETSNHEWDRPKPLMGYPMSGSQNVVQHKDLNIKLHHFCDYVQKTYLGDGIWEIFGRHPIKSLDFSLK
jgi:hypothetical protein